MKKPTVNINCVANRYARGASRIVEFSHGSDGTGGLISFRATEGRPLRVEVYRAENVVCVTKESDDLRRALADLLAWSIEANNRLPAPVTPEDCAAQYGCNPESVRVFKAARAALASIE